MTEQYDVLIVGGGFAGLSAALYTARGMKRGILCGTGPSRNVAAPHTHGFLAQDGADPAQLLQTARDQLAPYDFPVLDVHVERIVGENGDFTAQLANGDTLKARKIILATGVQDILPAIPGFQEEWGRTVHHCPYCYGWEVRGGRIAVYLPGLNNPQSALYYQKITRDVLVCTGGPANLTDEQRALLEACGVTLVEEPLSRVDGLGGDGLTLTFGSGLVHARDVLYAHGERKVNATLAEHLGCHVSSAGITVDEQQMTTVAGVYACGDSAKGNQVIYAAASGATAAMQAAYAIFYDTLPVGAQRAILDMRTLLAQIPEDMLKVAHRQLRLRAKDVPLISAEEAALVMGVSPTEVKRYALEGRLLLTPLLHLLQELDGEAPVEGVVEEVRRD